MAEVYKPLRLPGQLLTYVIDNALVSSRTRGQCVFAVKTLVMLLSALGFSLSWQKRQLVPVQHGKFLGLMIDSQQCKMFVPEDKKQYILDATAELLAAGTYTQQVCFCWVVVPTLVDAGAFVWSWVGCACSVLIAPCNGKSVRTILLFA